MNKCPHCSKVTITIIDKLFLGPASTIRCSTCNGVISVPWYPSIIMSILLIFMLYLIRVYDSIIIVGIGIISVFGYLYLHVKYVPLVQHKDNGYL